MDAAGKKTVPLFFCSRSDWHGVAANRGQSRRGIGGGWSTREGRSFSISSACKASNTNQLAAKMAAGVYLFHAFFNAQKAMFICFLSPRYPFLSSLRCGVPPAGSRRWPEGGVSRSWLLWHAERRRPTCNRPQAQSCSNVISVSYHTPRHPNSLHDYSTACHDETSI